LGAMVVGGVLIWRESSNKNTSMIVGRKGSFGVWGNGRGEGGGAEGGLGEPFTR